VATSVVALLVRRGNPLRIRGWRDLLRPGVEVLTPSPATSGAARWNLLAAYGAASGTGADPGRGVAYLRELLREHVRVQDKGARDALQSCAAGTGDVLISYEHEAVLARRRGAALDHVVPEPTILVELPIAVRRGLFTIAALGGWARMERELLDPERGAVARIDQGAGDGGCA
jgi:sulfate transport system substrate-binding protein